MYLPIREITKEEWVNTGTYFGIPIAVARDKVKLSLILTLIPLLSVILIIKYWEGSNELLNIPITIAMLLVAYTVITALRLLYMYSPVHTEILEITYEDWIDRYNKLEELNRSVVKTDSNTEYETLLKMALVDYVTKSGKERTLALDGILSIDTLNNIDKQGGKSHIFIETYRSRYRGIVLTFKAYIVNNDSNQVEKIYEL